MDPEQFIDPPPIEFSFAAPGWYAVAAILFAILMVVGVIILKNYRKNHYRREALRWLNRMEKSLSAEGDYVRLIYVADMLVKRIGIRLKNNTEPASLRGSEWFDYLHQTCPSLSFSETDQSLLDAVYVPGNCPDERTVSEFVAKMKRWIKKHHAS